MIALFMTVPLSALGQAPVTGPDYLEEIPGESTLILDFGGVGGWVTDRAPASGFTPMVLGVGFGHRVGTARLAWRLHLFQGVGDAPLSFIYADFVSVEQVLAEGTLRPYWRLAVGFGLDLVGDHQSLGTQGYFNADNGASAGMGLAHGWGVDIFMGTAWFLRIEATVRLYTGTGRSGVLLSSHLGLGYAY